MLVLFIYYTNKIVAILWLSRFPSNEKLVVVFWSSLLSSDSGCDGLVVKAIGI